MSNLCQSCRINAKFISLSSTPMAYFCERQGARSHGRIAKKGKGKHGGAKSSSAHPRGSTPAVAGGAEWREAAQAQKAARIRARTRRAAPSRHRPARTFYQQGLVQTKRKPGDSAPPEGVRSERRHPRQQHNAASARPCPPRGQRCGNIQTAGSAYALKSHSTRPRRIHTEIKSILY